MAYSTDEDTRGIDSDPLSNRFDLGNDTVAFAKQRVKVVNEMWPKLVDQVTKEGDGYQQARQAFGVLLSTEGEAMFMAARYVGGVYVNRSHKGDPKAAGAVRGGRCRKSSARRCSCSKSRCSATSRSSSRPSLYNHLAASHWEHWGTEIPHARRLSDPRGDRHVAGPHP